MHMRMHMEQKQNSEDDGVMLETFKVLYFSEPDSPELLVILKEMPKGYSLEKGNFLFLLRSDRLPGPGGASVRALSHRPEECDDVAGLWI